MPEQPGPRPFTTFNFFVELTLDSGPNANKLLCNAAFAECDGLEMTMQLKTYQEGGNNSRPILLAGPVTYGQLSLKRGMTTSFDLWNWFDEVMKPNGEGYGVRASGVVVMLASDGVTERARFELMRCLPVKIKAPALNAKDGAIAIEEMQIAYERLKILSTNNKS